MDLSLFLADLPLIALISAAASIVIFPVVFLMTLVYDWLIERYERVPKFLFMLSCTFVGVLLAALAIYAYVGIQLASLMAGN